ncbi:MAG: cytochrome-c peroxidase [Planctomycetota bacterium]|jgi:cytochrome c peroxidase
MPRLIPSPQTAVLLVGILALASVLASQEPSQEPSKPPILDGVEPSFMQFFAPLPANMETDGRSATEAQVSLGRKLFFEERLSKDGTISCNSCHGLDSFGVDNRQFSLGVDGQLGGRNAPSVFHAAGHVSQFWDGRATDVEEQALGPILNPVEMAMDSAEQVVAILADDAEYLALFETAFPGEEDALSWNNVGRAIGAFERQLVMPGRWDAFLEGDVDAITPLEKEGFKAFLDTGCFGCHNGPYMGGQIYMKLGLIEPWPNQEDPGRFAITGKEGHKMVFKVPSLRNVAETGPYFHDGSVEELDVAVQMMAKHQRGKELRERELEAIVAYLGCLTGDAETEE